MLKRCLARFALACAAVLCMAMPAVADTLNARVAQLSSGLTVTRPEGAGPFPVVIMLHGCGGPRPFINDMARHAADAGAAAIVVDSYAPRRISRMAALATVCTGTRLHGRERAGDLYAAVTWARRQSWAARDRIAVMGWSHGGWTVLDALSLRSGEEMARATGISNLPAEPLSGVQSALIVYPYTGLGSLVGRRDWRFALRSTAIVAGRDYIVGTNGPREALNRQRLRGAPLDIVLFENATHAFEDPLAQDPRVRFNPSATTREIELLREMIAAL
ncbi:MAG: dienelactone hydrolase family protein [Hyphomonadaceae bacterium]